MLKIFAMIVNLCLITIIFFQIPKESMGLSSFTIKSNLLGSPASTRRFLTIITILGILLYFGIALKLNLVSA